jgi:hypothetical protein
MGHASNGAVFTTTGFGFQDFEQLGVLVHRLSVEETSVEFETAKGLSETLGAEEEPDVFVLVRRSRVLERDATHTHLARAVRGDHTRERGQNELRVEAHGHGRHLRELDLEPRSVAFFLKTNVEAVAEQTFVAKERPHGFAERSGNGDLVADDAEHANADFLREKEPERRFPGPVQRGFDQLFVCSDVDQPSLVAVEPMGAQKLGDLETGEIEGSRNAPRKESRNRSK